MRRAIARSESVHGRNKHSGQTVRKLRARIKRLRSDAHHQATTAIAGTGGVMGIEELNIRGMQNKRIVNATLGGFLVKLGYKG